MPTKKHTIKIVIAEDHTLMRQGYISLLKERDDFEVIGEAENGKILLEVLKVKKPDVILLDLEMPVMKGGEAYEEIKLLYPDIKTIIISPYYDDTFVSEYFMKGVNGYLPKNCEAEQMFEAIDTVMTEQYYFTKAISRFLLSKMMKDKQRKIELEILKMLCDEKTSKMIGEKLGVTPGIVDHHRRSIQAKTKQSSVVGLVKFAIKNGLTELN